MSDPETIEIMAVIHMWLDHWKDVLSEPDGPAHAREFIDSMPELIQHILRIVSDQEDEE
jgi:hypothetical protein